MSTAHTHVRLEFDRLIRDYLENLNVTLRGFKAAEEFEFLATFVPSEDPTESLLELAELSRDAGVTRLTVAFEPTTLARINLAAVEKAAGPLHRRDGQPLVELDLVFGNAPALAIHPAYRAGLAQVLANISHQGALQAAEGLDLCSATRDGVTLAALVRPTDRVVTKAAFAGAANPAQCGLMESLCAYMAGKPIQECADHAGIFIERGLRSAAEPAPVSGLVTPENADPAFALPERLVRDLLANYRQASGYAETGNFFDPPPSLRWRARTEQQRSEEVVNAMRVRGVADKIELVAMEGHKRVVIRFTGEMDSVSKQHLLADLEKHLHQEVEPTLHLVAQGRTDKNVIRLPDKRKTS